MKIFAHWELKTVSLVLAVSLWTYTAGQVRVERTVAVQVTEAAVVGLPDDHQLTTITPHEFKVRVSVPSSRLAEFEGQQITPRLALTPDGLRQRGQDFPITSAVLGLKNDIRIISTEPENIAQISVSLDQITEADFDVEPPQVTGLPAGIEATVPQTDVTRVRLRAPSTTLEVMRAAGTKVRFKAVALDGTDALLTRPRQERIALTPVDSTYQVQRTVYASFTVRPRPGVPRSVTLPVEVLGSRDLLRSMAVDIDQPRLALTIRGPENLLAALKPELDLIAYVRLREDLKPGEATELPVGVLVPPWMAVEPATVRVTLNPLRPATPENETRP